MLQKLKQGYKLIYFVPTLLLGDMFARAENSFLVDGVVFLLTK